MAALSVLGPATALADCGKEPNALSAFGESPRGGPEPSVAGPRSAFGPVGGALSGAVGEDGRTAWAGAISRAHRAALGVMCEIPIGDWQKSRKALTRPMVLDSSSPCF